MLISKLVGTRDTLAKYKPADLGKPPMRAFAEDYNRAREIALKESPHIADFAPPALEIKEGTGLIIGPWISGTYLDILTYSEQLIRLVRSRDSSAGH